MKTWATVSIMGSLIVILGATRSASYLDARQYRRYGLTGGPVTEQNPGQTDGWKARYLDPIESVGVTNLEEYLTNLQNKKQISSEIIKSKN